MVVHNSFRYNLLWLLEIAQIVWHRRYRHRISFEWLINPERGCCMTCDWLPLYLSKFIWSQSSFPAPPSLLFLFYHSYHTIQHKMNNVWSSAEFDLIYYQRERKGSKHYHSVIGWYWMLNASIITSSVTTDVFLANERMKILGVIRSIRSIGMKNISFFT